MGTVPASYYQFIIDYAPYFYYIPGTGVDPEWGRGPAPAAHAIDFLYEAYYDSQFESKKTEISSKIVALADYLLSIQCNDNLKLAYGGFKSKDGSDYYYSIDAMRAIPTLLKAYDLTGTTAYLNATELAGETFLYNMQHKPSELGQHDRYYGGFAQAVTTADAWLLNMHIIDLHGLVGLKMLYDRISESQYKTMIDDALGFYREGFEDLYLYYKPPPSGDGEWHRIGSSENEIYDDDFSYALNGLFWYEGWSETVEKVYTLLNAISSSVDYPVYNPAVCWAGYIDVVSRKPACEYYDAVTSGILRQIRAGYDALSLEFSVKIISLHQDEFMYWGPKFTDYSPVENKKATVTVSWLSLLFLKYNAVLTPFTRVLRKQGERVTLHPVREAKEYVSYGEELTIKAIVNPTRPDEIVIEPGYIVNDYITIHVFSAIRYHDKIEWQGVAYEIGPVEDFRFQGKTMYRRAVCRRLIG
ncbi:MAG: hypothetical protein JSV12_06155 [Candidatus Bathyarchaeota archaeon]|nr:MAG: hypothetical protein JSV12_06155 [Candidatus Bathyarchaeota archaeon]